MNDSSNNIRFSYLYRDGGNYKLYGEVIFSNQEAMLVDEIELQIRQHLLDGEFFNPTDWGIVPLSFDKYDEEMDHQWHEYERIEETRDENSDNRSIKTFIEEISCK